MAMRSIRTATLGCSAAASLAASLVAIGFLAATLPTEVEAQAGCNKEILLDDIAKEIQEKTSKAAKKFKCANPMNAVCSQTGCQVGIRVGGGYPWSCKVEILEEDLGKKVNNKRQKAAAKYGCSASGVIHCAPETAGGSWECKERLTLLQKSARSATEHPSGGCNERLLLENLAEELHDELKEACSFVTSVTCPALDQWKKEKKCTFGIGHEEFRLCDMPTQMKISQEAKGELKKGKGFGCPTDRASFCTRDPETEWLSCDFLAAGEVPKKDEL